MLFPCPTSQLLWFPGYIFSTLTYPALSHYEHTKCYALIGSV